MGFVPQPHKPSHPQHNRDREQDKRAQKDCAAYATHSIVQLNIGYAQVLMGTLGYAQVLTGYSRAP